MWILPLFILAWLAESKSSGIVSTADVGIGCDWEVSYNPLVINPQWGCQGNKWNTSNDFAFARGFCLDKSLNTQKFMWWVGAPKDVNIAAPGAFSIRTGDGTPASDPKSYVPGRYISIYVKALKFDTMYKGLLMFAKNSNNTKVGDWNVPLEASPQFAVYPSILCKNSVMHFNAEDKPYVAKFNFYAPPAGTGTIRIKAMLKTGPPNPTDFGDFYIMPEIVLTESVANDVHKWVLLNGTSCDTYCKQNNDVCNNAALGTSMDGIQPNPLDTIYPCHGAVFHDCTGNPRVQLPDRFCTYADSKCATNKAMCTLVPDANTPMFCICGAPITGAPTPGPGGVTPPNVGASSHLVPSLGAVIALLSMGMWGTRSQMAWGTVALFLAAAPMASAHNWMEGTRGRASNLGANQFCSPAFPQVNRQKIHMQVAIGQDFVVEWASAHGDSTYWIVIHDDARANVSLLTRTLMDNWLANCPQADKGFANTSATGMMYQRFRPNKNLQSNGPVNAQSSNPITYANAFLPNPIFSGPVWDSFSLMGGRPTTFYSAYPGMIQCYNGCTDCVPGYNCSAGPRSMLAEFNASLLSNDRKCSYTNASNPWIHTIHRYAHHDVSDGFGTALIQIPPAPISKGAGRYQLHYKWSSYCDTIDIDVKAQGSPVVNPYGLPINATDITYDIAHHCYFSNPRQVGQCVEVVTTPQQCEALCNTDNNCRAFQLLPLQLDSSNGDKYGLYPDSSYIPWKDLSIKKPTNSYCDKSQFAQSPKAGSMICYTVTQFQDDFNSARPLWSFTDDTNHQGFYGTCYIKPVLRSFAPPISIVAEDQHTTFRFQSKCIPCDNIGQDLTNPRWGPQQQYCTDCSLPPKATPRSFPPVPTWTKVSDGTFNQSAHWLSPGGSPYAFDDECKTLAARDPTCSKYVMYSDYRAQRYGGNIVGSPPSSFYVTTSGGVSVGLVNGSVAWHYNMSLASTLAYFRTCACLDKTVGDMLGGGMPILDSTQTALACDGVKAGSCMLRNFTIYKLA